MEKSEKILAMFIGKTHSGKTTLAKKIKETAKEAIIIEADPIAILMKEQFPELRQHDDKEHDGSFNKVSLKFRTFLLFVEYALSLEKPIILSNSNMWLKGRELVFELCKKTGYKVIGVYFDLPEEVILNRIKKSERSTNVLRTAKDFKDLIEKQKTRMQLPDSSLFDEFFVVKSEADVGKIEKELISKFA